MYLKYFKLEDNPFRLTPDPRYLFLSKAHSRAKAYMDFSLWKHDSFVVITGDIGSGKTTLIESLIASMKDNVVVARIHQTQLDENELLQAILVEFGFKPFSAGKVELLDMLNNFLMKQYKKDNIVLLIIDEAQNLTPRVLEEIRLLSGLETHTEKMLNVLLVGQPELNEVLDSMGLEQLVQRVRLRFHVGPLSEAETGDYIQHRLTVAGAENAEMFSPETVAEIYKYTGGTPRLINILCDTILMGAFVESAELISKQEVDMAIDELQWLPFVDRVSRKVLSEPYAIRPNLGIPPKLIVTNEGRKLGEYYLDKQTIMIGRGPNNDIQLNDPKVSSSHAQIVTTRRNSYLIDLGSKNGTYINNRSVKKYKLKAGDVFSITSKYILEYVRGEEEEDQLYLQESADDTINNADETVVFQAADDTEFK